MTIQLTDQLRPRLHDDPQDRGNGEQQKHDGSRRVSQYSCLIPFSFNRGEGRENLRVVAIIDDDILAGVGRPHDRVDGIGKLNAKRTGHDTGIDGSQCAIARPNLISSMSYWVTQT